MKDRLDLVERHYQRVARQLRWGAVAFVIVTAGGMAAQKHNSDRTGDALALIQQQRVENTRNGCERQNANNARVKAALFEIVPGSKVSGKQHNSIVKFADAVALPQDCDDVVRERTGHK